MERHSLRRFYGRQIFKGALFASTALVLPAVSPRLAFAQIAPNTTPQGGQIVGGSAAITQATGSTTINQASQNAAINWQSFNVGSAAKVQFNQPDASAIALNRVVGGNLSQINGQINANGQIVLINQSGVVFGKGSQVNAESVVVSTSDIATSDFMAGKMNFTGAPKPGAQIINNGNITARDAGLVGLVAPQVANNGLITASLGQVILAGGSAFTLDLYGDRLISLDVTQAVRAVDIGGKTLPALVTNSGLIIADGGKITLTARDADALVTQLINAGGILRADSVGAQTGTISVQGIGGNISIAGSLLARGTAAGTKGGSVQALTDGTVALAAGADINVSGAAGGGDAAIGTNLARAALGPTDKTAPAVAVVTIAQGAGIHADATALGNAGTITVLSHDTTDFAGDITDQGGTQGGDGGLVELSSDGVINLSGTVLATAIDGHAGEILLDPQTLDVVAHGTSSTSVSQVDVNYLDGLHGNVVLDATQLLQVLTDVTMNNATSLTLDSGGNISILGFISIAGSLEIDAAASLYIGPSFAFGVFISTGGIDANNVALSAGSNIEIDAPIISAGSIALQAPAGSITEGSKFNALQTVSGALETPLVTGGTAAFGGDVDLTNVNAIGTLSNVMLSGGHTLVVNDAAPLIIAGDVGANNITFISSDTKPTDNFGFSITGTLDAPGQLIFDSAKLVTEASNATISTALLSLFGNAAHGTVSLLGAANAITALGSVNAIDNLFLADKTVLTLASATNIAKAFQFTGDGLIETGTGALDVPIFSATSLTGDALLTNPNKINTLSGVSADGTFILDDAVALTILDAVTAKDIFLTAPSLNLGGNTLAAGSIAAPSTLSLTADTISATTGVALNAPGGTIMLAPLTATDPINLTTSDSAPSGLLIGPVLLTAITAGSESELVLGNALTSGTIGFGASPLDALDLGRLTVDLQTSGAIDLNASFISAATFAFDGAGINQTGFGTLDAGLVTGNGGAITGNVRLDGTGNSIVAMSNISIAGNHELLVQDTQKLSAGGLQASTIALDANAITLSGNISASNLLSLATPGRIFQSSGIITTGSLTGTAGSDISLGDTGNQFGTLGALSATGDILLNSLAFSIAGSVTTQGALTLEGGGATELSGSALQVATLTSAGNTIAGNVDLTAGSNTIGLLTNFLVGSGFGLNLDDTGLLNLAGTVSAGHASLTADTLALGGALNITNALTLGSANGLTQTAGTITAGTLASSGAITGGDVSLDRGNHIGTIGNFAVGTGNFTLGDAGTVAIAGTIDVGDFEFLLDVGGLTETGVINAETLAAGTTLGNVSLTGNNGIANLAGFALTGNFALFDTIALTLEGILSTGADKSVSFGGAGVTEATAGEGTDAGGIDAGTLSGIGTIAGDMLLDQTNTIGAVNNLALTGTLTLADTAPSLAIGDVQAASATFFNQDNSTFDVSGFLNLAGNLAIDVAGAVLTETGSITAASLTSDGFEIASAKLNGVNHIGALDSFTATGAFSLTDEAALTIAAPLIAAGINLADTSDLEIDALLQATSGGIAIAAPSVLIDAAGTIAVPNAGLVSVAADTFANTGTITAPAGTFAIAPYNLTVIDLGGTAANALDLSASDFAIADLSELIIGTAAGHTAATVTIDDFSASTSIALVSLFASGEITDAGLLDANAIAFSSAGFGQSAGGQIITGRLEAGGAVTGDVSLASATNSIAALGALTLTGGALTLNDQVSLHVAGAVLAQDITLEDLVAIALGAPVSVTSGGTIKLITDALTDPGSAISAGPAGTVEISPYTAGENIDLGGSSIFGLHLSPGLISLISAGELAIGTAGGGVIFAEGSVSISPAELLLTGSAIDFEGTLAGPGLLTLAAAGAVSEAPDAVISFATIAGVGGDTGLGGQNTIGTIGDFSASGNIVLNDFESLVIAGLVQTTGDISLEGNFFREIAGGILSAATLNSGFTTIGGDVFLTNANSIGVLDNFFVDNAGTLDFVDGQALILGDVSAPNATLSASSLDFEGGFTATGLLALQTAGSVTEGAGTISAGTLISLGSIGGNVLLTGQNEILSLGAFSLGTDGTLDLTDASALAITGPVTAPITTLSADGINFAGNVDAATNLVLASTGTVTQSSGIITTALLSGLDTLTGDLLLGGANQIGTLANIALGAGDTLSLNDAGNLTLAGAITAPYASFTAPTIALTGNLDAADILAFSGALVDQTGGGITAGTLASLDTIGGDMLLLGANTISTLGNIQLLGNFELNDKTGLHIAGTLATPNLVRLEDTQSIIETGGVINAATFDTGGTTIGNVLNLGDLNNIGTLGAVTAGSEFDLVDAAAALKIAGTVFAPGIFLSAHNTDLAGALNGTILTLGSLTGISESTGTISVSTLTSFGTIGGNVLLTNANVIATIANFTMANLATLDLRDIEGLTLAGTVIAPNATFTAPSLTFDGAFNAGNILALTSATSVIEGAGGEITAGTLTSLGTVDGDVFLTGQNTIGHVANFTVGAGNTFDLNDTGLLTIDGPLSGPFITLASATIAIPGIIENAQTLDFASPGTIFEDGGSIFATTLTSRNALIGGDLTLLGNNTIGTIANIAIGGNFALNNTGSLYLTEITDSTGTFTLEDNSNVSGGLIQVDTLTSGNSTIGGDVRLTTSNDIKNLGDFTLAAGHTFVLSNEAFNVTGTVVAPFMTIESGPNVNISGAIDSTYLNLQDGNVTETTGTISAETLTGGASDLLLGNANLIGTLTNFTANTISVNDIEALVLAGSIIAPESSFAAAGLTFTGSIDAADKLALGSTANITQTGGALTAGTLISLGTITGAVALTDANSIAVIGNFAAAGDISLKNVQSYSIEGILAAGDTLTLEGAGVSEAGGAIHAATLTSGGTRINGGATLNGANAIATLADFKTSTNLFLNDTEALFLAGTIAAGNLGLSDTANISQTSGGAILASTLTSNGAIIGGGVTLNGAGNSISVLGGFSAASLALFDTANLTIAAPVSLAGALALADTGLIDQTGGNIIAALLSSDGLAVAQYARFDQPGNQIAAIGNFTAGGLSVTDDENLALTGVINTGGLYLLASGFNITQTGGTIGAGLLDASGAGISLGQRNSIAALGIVNATDLLANGVLSVTGPVNIGAGTITSPDGLAISGNISASGDLSLSSVGYLNQTAGLITAANANLTGYQNIRLAGTDNATGTFAAQAFGGFTAAGTITGQSVELSGFSNFTQTAGTIAGIGVQLAGVLEAGIFGTVSATNLFVASSHLIDDEAARLTAQTATFAAGESGVVLNGNNSIAGQLVASGGSVYQKSGTIQAGDLTFTSSNYFIELAGRLLANTATLTALNTRDLSNYTGIMLSGGVSIGGALALNSGTGIEQSGGYITTNNLTGTAVQGITLASNINAGNVALTAGGTILQTSGAVLNASGASLTGAGVSLYGTDNIAGNLTARDADFRQSGNLTAANAYLSSSNYLGLNGGVSITNALDVTAGNFIADNATSLSAQTATFQAPFMFLNGVNNFTTNLLAKAAGGAIVEQRGAITAPLVNLAATGSITLDGALTASNASLAAGGIIALNGTARVTDDLDLRAVGDIFAPGTVAAGTLTGAVTGAGNEQAIFLGNETIGTIGSFVMQDSTFALNDRGPLTITGPLVANAVSITAVGQITLDGSNQGGLFISGTIAPKTQTIAGAGDSVLEVTQGADGAMPAIIQTGTFYVDSGPLAAVYSNFANAPATLFMMTMPAGNIEFEPAPPDNGGLVGPSIDVVMSVGNGGTVSGNVDLLTLVLLSGKATNLTGMLDGLSGEAASGKGSVVPFPKPPYQFNACPIGSVNCIILPIETLPPGNPLQNFDIDQRKKKRLDKNVALPGVATRDF
jgi:filamentous hemagglutinin family protein